PATIFVTPAFLGGETFWWDELGQEQGGELDPALRSEALTRYSGLKAEVLAARPLRAATTTLPSPLRATSVERLSSVSRLPGIVFGSHTWSHPNLTRLDPERLQRELN